MPGSGSQFRVPSSQLGSSRAVGRARVPPAGRHAGAGSRESRVIDALEPFLQGARTFSAEGIPGVAVQTESPSSLTGRRPAVLCSSMGLHQFRDRPEAGGTVFQHEPAPVSRPAGGRRYSRSALNEQSHKNWPKTGNSELSRHSQHDLAEVTAFFHPAVRLRSIRERMDRVNDWSETAGSERFSEFPAERANDSLLLLH